MKIMVLTPYLPHRAVGHGGGTAVRDLVTWLAKRHEVLVAAMVRPGEEDRLAEVEELGVAVAPLLFRDHGARGTAKVAMLRDRTQAWGRSLSSGYPWYVEKYWSSDLSRQVVRLAADFKPDAIQIEYLQLSLLVRDLRHWRDSSPLPGTRLVLNSHELGSVPRERRADRSSNPLTTFIARREASSWRRLQVDASRWADRTLCVTPEDHALYCAMGGKNLERVPLGMDLERIQEDWAPAAGHRFMFLGSFDHRPNRLAADFLLDEVWPAVSGSLPGSRLTLAGRGSRRWLESRGAVDAWQDKGVTALGFVEDLTSLFRDSHLFLAPLPEGGGIKIKILEAMARGIPVVTTPIGAEGITQPEDDAVVIAPCDPGFPTIVLETVGNMDAARSRAHRARALIEKRFSWAAITERLTEIYGENKGRNSVQDRV